MNLTVFIGSAAFAVVLLAWLLILHGIALEIWNLHPPWFRRAVAAIFAVGLIFAGQKYAAEAMCNFWELGSQQGDPDLDRMMQRLKDLAAF